MLVCTISLPKFPPFFSSAVGGGAVVVGVVPVSQATCPPPADGILSAGLILIIEYKCAAMSSFAASSLLMILC